MECTKRVGYHDFKACAEQLASGKYQGFVHVRHHKLVGTVQTVFRAGRPVMDEAEALANAEARMADLIRLVTA